MKLEVLLSCMNEKNFDIIDRSNIKTDVLVVNQCNLNGYQEKIKNNKKFRMIQSTKRGLSRSRNELLNNMNGDIGILCDDDVIYYENYEEIILSAFKQLKDADIIIFDTEMINYFGPPRKKIRKIRRAPKNRNYGSVRIAFRRESFYKNNLWFNINFGAGSKYLAGEESLLLREANRKNLKIYEYPAVIAKVDYSSSSWFNGYNEKYFYDKGAWLKTAYPKTYYIYMWYFIFKFYGKCNLTFFGMIKNIVLGIKEI